MSQKDYRQWFQYLAAISGTLPCFCAGIGVGWPSPTIPKLLSGDPEITPVPFITHNQATWIVTLTLLTSALCTSIACILADNIGRKRTLVLAGGPFLASALLISNAKSVAELCIARILLGMGSGIATSIPTMYIAEIAEIHIRGRLLGNFSVTFFSGILFAYITGTIFSIQDQALVTAIIPAVFIAIFIWMPETPYYYIVKNKYNKARESLQRLRRTKDVEDELETIANEIRREQLNTKKISYWNMLTEPGLRRALFTAIGLIVADQLTGIIPITVFSETILREAQATNFLTPSKASILLQSCLVLSAIASTFCTDRFGRRPILQLSALMTCLTLFLLTIYFALQNVYHIDTSKFSWIAVTIIALYLIFYVCGMGSMCICMCSEFFPMEYKLPAVICAITVMNAGGSIAIFIFDVIRSCFGFEGCFGFFATFCLCDFVFITLCVPETARKSFSEIQKWFHIKQDDEYVMKFYAPALDDTKLQTKA